MKYLTGIFILLVFTAIAFPFLLMAGGVHKGFRGQTDYYIGVQRPDGTCETVEVYATDFNEAKKVVRDQFCDHCKLRDLTFDYSSGGSNLFASAAKHCPLSG